MLEKEKFNYLKKKILYGNLYDILVEKIIIKLR